MCWVAPLKTGSKRYSALPLELECNTVIEDERHIILKCPINDNIRNTLYEKIGYMNVSLRWHSEVYLFVL